MSWYPKRTESAVMACLPSSPKSLSSGSWNSTTMGVTRPGSMRPDPGAGRDDKHSSAWLDVMSPVRVPGMTVSSGVWIDVARTTPDGCEIAGCPRHRPSPRHAEAQARDRPHPRAVSQWRRERVRQRRRRRARSRSSPPSDRALAPRHLSQGLVPVPSFRRLLRRHRTGSGGGWFLVPPDEIRSPNLVGCDDPECPQEPRFSSDE